ncbi:MAG: hypothetical protein ABJA62_05590 [Luteimonas sp.]
MATKRMGKAGTGKAGTSKTGATQSRTTKTVTAKTGSRVAKATKSSKSVQPVKTSAKPAAKTAKKPVRVVKAAAKPAKKAVKAVAKAAKRTGAVKPATRTNAAKPSIRASIPKSKAPVVAQAIIKPPIAKKSPTPVETVKSGATRTPPSRSVVTQPTPASPKKAIVAPQPKAVVVSKIAPSKTVVAAKPYAANPQSAAPTKTESAPARKITPNQALANTRKLLEAKRKHDRQPQPWQTLDPEHDHVPQAGSQAPEATEKAEGLHAAESQMQGAQGSASTQDRRAQHKRDKR